MAQYHGLTPRYEQIAEDVLGRLNVGVRLAYYSGSIPAGLGHATSDLDIHIVTEGDRKPARRGFLEDGVRVQFTIVTEAELSKVVDQCRAFVAGKNDRWQIELTAHELWQISRLACSAPLRAEFELGELYRSFDRAAARQVLMANYAQPVANSAEDVQGFLEVGDAFAAHAAAAIALRSATEVGLIAAGEIYTKEKFVPARARRSVWADQFQPLWRLQYGSAEDPTEKSVEAMLFAAQSLVSAGLITAWDEQLAGAPALEPRSGGPLRSPYWGLMRFADCFALASAAQALNVTESVARVWTLLDGRPLDGVIAELGASGAPAEMVVQTVDRLVATEAVITP